MLKDIFVPVFPLLLTIPALFFIDGGQDVGIACWTFSNGLMSGFGLYRSLARHGKV